MDKFKYTTALFSAHVLFCMIIITFLIFMTLLVSPLQGFPNKFVLLIICFISFITTIYLFTNIVYIHPTKND
ncbi:hypothetical protein [Halalkalibacter lacteus]|uniref:hypothetical protein n=1 Tax=Halalkalibacter lacteus TaxID=3090663 RepID=UPI002FC7DD2A